MCLKWVWLVTTALQAQARGQDARIIMMDNCADNDPAYGPFGGCPEGAPFPGFTSSSAASTPGCAPRFASS